MPQLHDDVGFLLSRASGMMVRSTNAALSPEGLRVRQYSVLALACEADEGISQRDLAAALGLDPSQVVALVDELVDTGIAERRPAPTDRRTRLVAPTEKGRAVRRDAGALASGAVQHQLRALSADEQETLRDMLSRVIHTPEHDDPEAS